MNEMRFQEADIIASEITSLSALDNMFDPSDNPLDSSFLGGVEYRFTLVGPVESDNNALYTRIMKVFVKPNTGSSLINSLAGLESVISSNPVDQGGYYLPENFLIYDNDNGGGGSGYFYPALGGFSDSSSVDVPEPNSTVGLLSAGTMGALLLLKRKKRSKLSNI
ncbi:MAG TPA: PEP-CTERM sorting domain-containing protein [Candidatus Obscuribacterales bacterium]